MKIESEHRADEAQKCIHDMCRFCRAGKYPLARNSTMNWYHITTTAAFIGNCDAAPIHTRRETQKVVIEP